MRRVSAEPQWFPARYRTRRILGRDILPAILVRHLPSDDYLLPRVLHRHHRAEPLVGLARQDAHRRCPETVAALSSEEQNFVLLRGHNATAGQQFNYLLNVPKKWNQVYEIRLRGPKEDKLVGYWEEYSGRPVFPPVLTFLGFDTNRKVARPTAPQGYFAFILGVLGKGNPQTAAR